MGPKKKEEEIDLSTLPQCTSLNIVLLCKGKKGRAMTILERIQQHAQKSLMKIKKNDVLDHAKEKNIYIDPNTLTDKQKKDAKFMETISTQLTPEVIAKATQSLLSSHLLKARIEKKNNLNDKQPDTKLKPYDLLFAFDDFPQTKELAKCRQGIKFVFVIDPKISWGNAPQIQQNDDQGEQDEEIKQYKALLLKQEKTEEDIQFQNQINSRITQIKNCRTKSAPQSDVRNCTISILTPEIDPLSEEASVKNVVNQFFQHIISINSTFSQFEQWRQNKVGQKIVDKQIKVQHESPQGQTISQILASFAQSLDPSHDLSEHADQQESAILHLISSFDTTSMNKTGSQNMIKPEKKNQELKFLQDNQTGQQGNLAQQIRKNIKYPGIDRYLMPEVPTKSQKLRKLQQSQYAIFLKKGMDINELMRRLQILNFEQFIKQFDEQRPYRFGDRIYEQHHDKQSLIRQLYRALQHNEYNVFTKYDENSDSLYLMLLYKNNPRRINKKFWESNWKVIPNYQSWLKHFKNNQNNLNNTHFFDIDYQKVGNIQQNTRCFSLKSGSAGAVIINKECTVSNGTQSLLYSIKDNLIFGLQNQKFFAQHSEVRVYHYFVGESKEVETLIRLGKVVIRIVAGGNLVIEKQGESKMITSSGYTIIYRQQQSPAILHPNGSVTYSSNTYTNHLGYGLKNGHLFTCPTLKRKTEQGQIIKRDDNTTILNYIKDGNLQSKWIRFFDGTQYQVENNTISIEKQGYPFVKCFNDNIKVVTDELTIRITKRMENYAVIIQFEDGSSLRLNKNIASVFQEDELQEIQVNIQTNQISSRFEKEKLVISKERAELERDGKKFDAREEQQKYVQADVLPLDFIQPRLFIINNDNTGFELLNQKAINKYLKQNEHAIDRVYEKKNGDKLEKHIVANRGKVQAKFIKNKLVVDLDVFNNAKEENRAEEYKYVTLKSILKYEPLQPQDITQLEAIKTQIQEWRKQNTKEQNQFGHKPKNDPNTKTKMQNKLLTIKKRQQKTNKINSSSLRQTAKNFHLITYQEIKKQLQKQSKQKRMRSEFKNKRDSIIQQYKRVSIPKEHDEQEQDQKQGYQPFMDHYFMTNQGKKALSQMPEWVFRPKQIKAPIELDPQIKNQLNNTSNLNKEQSEQAKERYDTVEVNLNPKGQKQIYIKPSVFTQRQIDEERFAFESEKKAYKYHEAKRKDYNVYGQQRKGKPQVPTLLRTQPISEINQKYLVVQAPLDKKVRISSMKNKLTSSASNMIEMRKEGPHSLLIKTIDKGNDINKLLEKRTMMVQADLNDKLQRDILINPIQANFGTLLEKKTYELKITIKNQDVISQRITLKRPKTIYVKAAITQMGPIAMGMTRKIIVTLKASPQILGKFSDEFDIVTKHEIYHIPITAQVVSEGQWRADTCLIGKGVSEVDELQSSRKKESSFELPKIK